MSLKIEFVEAKEAYLLVSGAESHNGKYFLGAADKILTNLAWLQKLGLLSPEDATEYRRRAINYYLHKCHRLNAEI